MGQRITSWKASVDQSLHKKNVFTDILVQLENGTGVRRLVIVEVFTAFFCLYLMIGDSAQFLCNSFCFAYPAYMTFKAIENPRRENSLQWMTYWPVYSGLIVAEIPLYMITQIIPLYWLLKCGFLTWCFSSTQYNGSTIIYHSVIMPFMRKHQEQIDSALDKGKHEVVGLAKEVASKAVASNAVASRVAASKAADSMMAE